MLSSMEAEYVVQTHVAKEALWLHSFIGEIRGACRESMSINCDNQGAIALSKDNKFHAWTKHIDIRYHFICEAVEDGKIQVEYIPTDDNVADIFTKPLAKTKFCHFIEILRLWHPVHDRLRELWPAPGNVQLSVAERMGVRLNGHVFFHAILLLCLVN